MRAQFCRGAAFAETAVVMSFTLILLFGILQVVAVGYLQVAGDAATFFAAHEYTLGVAQNTITSTEATMVPAFVANAIQFTPAPPPSIDPSLFSNVYGEMDKNNRHGGYTLVRPQNFQVYLNQTGSGTTAIYHGVFGFQNTPITAGAVEGYYLMTQNEMDNFGVDPNTDVGGNILNSAYASPFLPQSDNIVANMNTPPYYLPNPIIKMCETPWSAGAGSSFGEQCGTSTPYYLGLGEYLSNYNYAPTTMAMGVGVGQVFQAMAAHQRAYADLIAAFPAISGTNAAQDQVIANIQIQFQNYTGVSGYRSVSCTSGSSCGAYYTPPSASFANGGTCSGAAGPQVPLAWYDPLYWWQHQNARIAPSWMHQMWQTEPTPSADPGGSADGPEGPNCGSASGNNGGWNGASFALVYYWDQPNFPGVPIGPGSYPTYPLQGAQIVGDPVY